MPPASVAQCARLFGVAFVSWNQEPNWLYNAPLSLHGVYRRDFCVLFNQSSIQGIFLTPLHLRFSPKEIDAISFFLRELDALSTK